MTDTAPRAATGAPRMLADALLRTVGGSTALLRVTPATTDGCMTEVGLVTTPFAEVALSPAAMRRMRPTWQRNDLPGWELLVSASSVEAQVNALEIASARALFAMTVAVTVAGQDYLIDSIASNEAFGQVYLYRLLLREAQPQGL
jgi:hypothetical protein